MPGGKILSTSAMSATKTPRAMKRPLLPPPRTGLCTGMSAGAALVRGEVDPTTEPWSGALLSRTVELGCSDSSDLTSSKLRRRSTTSVVVISTLVSTFGGLIELRRDLRPVDLDRPRLASDLYRRISTSHGLSQNNMALT